MTKGVVYFVWGNRDKERELLYRSVRSVKKFGYKTTLITDKMEADGSLFDGIVRVEMPEEGLRKRKKLFDQSPYDLNLYLDIDTVMLDDVEFGFEMAKKWGISCSVAPAGMCYHAPGLAKVYRDELFTPDQIQYNCGVIFFRKKDRVVQKVFNDYTKYLEYKKADENDQPYFSQALKDNNFNPCVLPVNWNLRQHLVKGRLNGKVKIWHSEMEVPDNINEGNLDRLRYPNE